MTTRTQLTANNYGTYFSLDWTCTLADGVEHEIQPESPLVTKIVEQVEAKGYTMERDEAAEILNRCRE